MVSTRRQQQMEEAPVVETRKRTARASMGAGGTKAPNKTTTTHKENEKRGRMSAAAVVITPAATKKENARVDDDVSESPRSLRNAKRRRIERSSPVSERTQSTSPTARRGRSGAVQSAKKEVSLEVAEDADVGAEEEQDVGDQVDGAVMNGSPAAEPTSELEASDMVDTTAERIGEAPDEEIKVNGESLEVDGNSDVKATAAHEKIHSPRVTDSLEEDVPILTTAGEQENEYVLDDLDLQDRILVARPAMENELLNLDAYPTWDQIQASSILVSELTALPESMKGLLTASSSSDKPLPADAETGNRYIMHEALPSLNHMAVDVIRTIADLAPQEVVELVRRPQSSLCETYRCRFGLFYLIRRIFSLTEPLLDAKSLELEEPEQESMIKRANIATYVASIFGTRELGFSILQPSFIDLLLQDRTRISDLEARTLIDIKTHAIIVSFRAEWKDVDIKGFMTSFDDARYQFIEEGQTVDGKKVDLKPLARKRRQELEDTPWNERQLLESFRWEKFLQDFSLFVKDHLATYVGESIEAPEAIADAPITIEITETKVNADRNAQPSLENASSSDEFGALDIAEQAAHAVHLAMQELQSPSTQSAPQQPSQQEAPRPSAQNYPQIQFEHVQPQLQAQQQQYWNEQQCNQNSAQLNSTPSFQTMYPTNPDGTIPFPTSQTAPTQVLYERARQAASTKAAPVQRKPSTPNARRPWTPEEESALMSGLDEVKGPHWSQILALYGPNGSRGDVLKDRNQVQLKDKARNLKLFFLKTGHEVPYYLQFVTGELKTRAPSSAERAQRQALLQEQQATQQKQQTQMQGQQLFTAQTHSATTILGPSAGAGTDANMPNGTTTSNNKPAPAAQMTRADTATANGNDTNHNPAHSTNTPSTNQENAHPTQSSNTHLDDAAEAADRAIQSILAHHTSIQSIPASREENGATVPVPVQSTVSQSMQQDQGQQQEQEGQNAATASMLGMGMNMGFGLGGDDALQAALMAASQAALGGDD
ncbi:TTAGGG repeat binding factor [Agyrium rufum]|nr:TTAGGG repeat binding factor [Agyrium rufum]